MESAFEGAKGYELTELGQQFVHYAMTELPLKIEFRPSDGGSSENAANEGGTATEAANHS